MSRNDRSPLHPSALRVQDLTPGRQIICYNLELGILDRCRIKARPFVLHKSYDHPMFEDARYFVLPVIRNDGWARNMHLTDMGVLPYGPQGLWNDVNFTIDARKEHLLSDFTSKREGFKFMGSFTPELSREDVFSW